MLIENVVELLIALLTNHSCNPSLAQSLYLLSKLPTNSGICIFHAHHCPTASARAAFCSINNFPASAGPRLTCMTLANCKQLHSQQVVET